MTNSPSKTGPDSPFSTASLRARSAHDDQLSLEQRVREFLSREPEAAEDIRTRHAQRPMKLCCGLPEVAAEELDADTLSYALGNHGALIVRNYLPAAASRDLRIALDKVIDSSPTQDPAPSESGDFAYRNPPPILSEVLPGKQLGNARAFQKASGAAMCVETPAIAESLLDSFQELGLKELLAHYFGEAPCLSVRKWMLRRSLLPVAESGWHQDGAFMGTDIKSVNLWLPLTHCGGASGAPGMDMVPARLDDIVSADGAVFDWSVSQDRVEAHSQAQAQASDGEAFAPVSPEFFPGDALFFDHFFLHRTQFKPHFDRVRYAVETWFFGSRSFPKNQVPLAW